MKNLFKKNKDNKETKNIGTNIKIYAVKDTVQGAFMQPFYLQNDNVAKRAFSMAINDQASNWSKMAKDLQLYKLGEYDDETGIILSKVEYLAKGADYVNVLQQQQQTGNNTDAQN